MPLEFIKPERISLKAHPEFTEKWLQDRIKEDTSLLGLGDDVALLDAERIQHRAGRLDLLLHDEQLNRRYEVELMLGASDPSHIIRSIEYWDIERRRYPAYDHVAVLVAEDITSRFLNVMSLLAGSIPLIAIQFVALQIGDKIALHFVHVLDQTALRTDDEHETGGSRAGVEIADRPYWQSKVSPEVLTRCDSVAELMHELTGESYELIYHKIVVDVARRGGGETPVWLLPQKTLLRVGAYVPDPEVWAKRFNDIGQLATPRRGNKAVAVSFKPQDFDSQRELLKQFLNAALNADGAPGE